MCEWIFRWLAHPLVLLLAVPPGSAAPCRRRGRSRRDHGGRRARARLAGRRRASRAAQDAARERGGKLARLTGRASAFGRYLDSEVDLLVNAALFAGLGWTTGSPALALAGFLAVTSVLSLNFNVERLSRERGVEPEAAGGRATEILRQIYGVVYAPQDRLAEALVARRPALTSSFAVSVLANLGMSTQLAAFSL